MLKVVSSVPYVFLKFVFWQLWPVGCAGCTVFGCFWQTSLSWNFGQQFFSGPRYIVNTQLPAVGQTSKKHTVCRNQSLLHTFARLQKILSKPFIHFFSTNIGLKVAKKTNFNQTNDENHSII